MRIRIGIITSLMILVGAVSTGRAQTQNTQSQITTIALGPDRIGVVKTAPGITTRLVFLERVQDIICGDLYDPNSGTGSFVVQRIGNDIFLKPIVSKGVSNLFVKAGESSERTYSFDLVIGPVAQAYRIVNVVNAQSNPLAAAKQVKNLGPASRVPPLIRVIDVAARVHRDTPAGLPNGLTLVMLPPPPPPSSKDGTRPARSQIGSEPDGPSQRRAIKRIVPDFPDEARRAGAHGMVVVEVTLDDGGKVLSAQAVSGPELLRRPAIEAARLWRFAPIGRRNGSGQDTALVTFNFKDS